jgi:rhodanese-related sulfurtransferase
MNLISREELKEKLDRKVKFTLVNALGEWAFEANEYLVLSTSGICEMEKMLDPRDDLVIHCSNPSCPASIIGYQILERNGYKKIRCYTGGLQDWEEAGYRLEGSLVD